ncbi:hypothetical protein D3C72_669180 [compost metagenome]
MQAGGFCCGKRGRKFGDHAAKLMGFPHMVVRGVVVTCQRNVTLPAHRRNRQAVRLRPLGRQRQLLLFVARHFLVIQGVFALIIFTVLLDIGELTLAR